MNLFFEGFGEMWLFFFFFFCGMRGAGGMGVGGGIGHLQVFYGVLAICTYFCFGTLSKLTICLGLSKFSVILEVLYESELEPSVELVVVLFLSFNSCASDQCHKNKTGATVGNCLKHLYNFVSVFDLQLFSSLLKEGLPINKRKKYPPPPPPPPTGRNFFSKKSL